MNELQKPIWEYTAAELQAKNAQLQGPPPERENPRLAPHLGTVIVYA